MLIKKHFKFNVKHFSHFNLTEEKFHKLSTNPLVRFVNHRPTELLYESLRVS